MSITPSLAGTGRDYVVLQGRVHGTTLKIQGAGLETNRPYGLSIVVPIPSDLASWMKGLPVSIASLAGTNQRYFAMQSAEMDFETDKVRIQVAGPKLNRSYGAVFSVVSAELASFVEDVILTEVGGDDDDDDYDEEEITEDPIVELI